MEDEVTFLIIISVWIVGSIVALIFLLRYKRLEKVKAPIRDIAEANARGEVHLQWESYSPSQIEGEAHIRTHQEMQAHARGKPFYCNTFTEWRSRYYDKIYSGTLRYDQREQQHALKQKHIKRAGKLEAAKAVGVEKQRVEALDFHARILENKKNSRK